MRQKLRNYVWKIVHDTGAAEAIAEDAILRALEKLEDRRPSASFRNWLFSIARNMARHWIRDRKKEDGTLKKIGYRDTRSAFAETLTREALRIFDVEIQRLTEGQRKVLFMRIIDHLSYQEISERMGIRPGAARALCNRARNRLADWLGYMRAL